MSESDQPRPTPKGLAAQLHASEVLEDVPTEEGHFVVPEMVFFKLLCEAYEQGRQAGLKEAKAKQ